MSAIHCVASHPRFPMLALSITHKERKMIVGKLRLQQGWSQERLATLTGLSVRTIQRIEQGQQPGLESLKALAAVFELDVTQLLGGEMKGMRARSGTRAGGLG